MIIRILALFFCGYSIASEVQTFSQREVAQAAQLTIKEIREKFKERPEVGDFVIGIKFLQGTGLPSSMPEQAFKFFLKAGLRMPDARRQIFNMCTRGLCFPAVIEEQLNDITAHAQKGEIHPIALLVLLESIKTVPPKLHTELKKIIQPISTTHPQLLISAGLELRKFDASLTPAFFHLLADEYTLKEAQEVLGNFYQDGFETVPADRTLALTYHEKAAKQGSISSAVQAAHLYLQGVGGPENRRLALPLLQQGAQGGDGHSLHSLGILYFSGDMVPANLEQAITFFKRSADAGYAEGYTALGRLIEQGITGKDVQDEPNYHEAFRLFKAAADRGSVDAFFNLGFLYDTGLAGKVDHRKAKEYYNKILTSENPNLLAIKAYMHEEGIGVEQNLEKAREYYTQAIALGNVVFRDRLNQLNERIEQARKPRAQQPADQIEIPSVAKRAQQKPSPEQVAYGRRKFVEGEFKKTLNSKYPTADGSQVTGVDFENNAITISRPSDGTEVIINIDPEQKRRFKKANPYRYDERVSKWFEKLAAQGPLTPSEYDSTIRHAFPEKTDLVAQLFGYKMSEQQDADKSRSTLAISGTLIPGKTKLPISGSFVYGYDSDRLYHRFFHLDNPH